MLHTKLFRVISGKRDIDPQFFNFKIENGDIEDNIVEILAHQKDKNSISGYFPSVFISVYCPKYDP